MNNFILQVGLGKPVSVESYLRLRSHAGLSAEEAEPCTPARHGRLQQQQESWANATHPSQMWAACFSEFTFLFFVFLDYIYHKWQIQMVDSKLVWLAGCWLSILDLLPYDETEHSDWIIKCDCVFRHWRQWGWVKLTLTIDFSFTLFY